MSIEEIREKVKKYKRHQAAYITLRTKDVDKLLKKVTNAKK